VTAAQVHEDAAFFDVRIHMPSPQPREQCIERPLPMLAVRFGPHLLILADACDPSPG
jgi:hypothetical protein